MKIIKCKKGFWIVTKNKRLGLFHGKYKNTGIFSETYGITRVYYFRLFRFYIKIIRQQ